MKHVLYINHCSITDSKITNSIRSRNNIHDTTDSTTLVWGPFHLPGIFGIAVNVFAVAFGIIILTFSFFPAYSDVTPQTMNYSVLMTFAVILFAVVYYVLYARKEFKGPIMELEATSVE